MTNEMDKIFKEIYREPVEPDLKSGIFAEDQVADDITFIFKELFTTILSDMCNREKRDEVFSMINIDTRNLEPRKLNNSLASNKKFFDIAYELRLLREEIFNNIELIVTSLREDVDKNKLIIKLNEEHLGFEYIEIIDNEKYINVRLANYQKGFKPGIPFYDDQIGFKFDKNKPTYLFVHYITYNYNF
ncbi:hypothetical protein [Staphylococcus phage vB_StaM_SA1]|nr:hypothetical protein [Staphylococcus phage vB_StaM_SA1]